MSLSITKVILGQVLYVSHWMPSAEFEPKTTQIRVNQVNAKLAKKLPTEASKQLKMFFMYIHTKT